MQAASPADVDALVDRAFAALDSETEDEVLPAVEAAVLRAPGHARLWQAKALLHRGLDDRVQALPAFRRAAEIAPRDVSIAHGMAHAALEAGLPAIDLFRAALALAPQNDEIRHGLVSAELAEMPIDEVADRLERDLAGRPGWLAGHWLLARLRWMSGERAGFAGSLERAIARYPQEAALWQQLIFVLMHADRHEDALGAIAKARAALGAGDAFAAAEACALSESGQAAAAERLFARLPGKLDISVMIYRMRHVLRLGRPEDVPALMRHVDPAQGHMVVPYLSIALRMMGDMARWQWLEGDERFISVHDIAADMPDLARLAAMLRGLHEKSGQPLAQSVRGGTQTDGAIFSRIEPEFVQLRAAVSKAVERQIAALPPQDARHPLLAPVRGKRVRFTGSWSVRLPAQGHHSNHVHPGGWFSSALYVGVPDEADRGAPPAGWLQFGMPPTELGLKLDAFRKIEPKPGLLVLFPSTMWHGTVPFDGGERLTVAFDVAQPR